MTRIAVRSIAVVDEHGGGSAYEWTVTDDGKIISHGTAPTIIEAAMHAGNAVYDGWGYAESVGRLAVVGQDLVTVSPADLGKKPYEAPSLRHCCNRSEPCGRHAPALSYLLMAEAHLG